MSGAAELARIEALQRYRVLDTLPEAAYEDLVLLAASICRAPIALVSLVDEGRQWFKARLGLDVDQTPRSISFCDHAIRNPGEVMVVADATRDARFAGNPLVTGAPNIRFYAGAPLVTDEGHALGTICVIDDKPRGLDEAARAALSALSRQVMRLFEARQRNLELQRLAAERELMTHGMIEYQRQLEVENAGLVVEASHDALTGLLNRSGLEKLGGAAMTAKWLASGVYSVAVLDLDHFKRINDTHGHAAGDEAIRAVATEIRRNIRGGDIAVRYGGEEFLLLMPGTPMAGAMTVTDRIRLSVAARDDLKEPLTLSGGIACGTSGLDDPEAVFRAADQALYRAKRGGRNQIQAAED
ncbi:MAG TPA: sensor domain-containing diguanylate cyclase [Arenimonas sp.]|uniref:GGDEF domain-containing protein n=1 Tax=Arenimonas sp. TaxID=1872635 RepID=UPI002D7FBD47|nr:sensor domain-containing diguanylate cyclase [Arenimonas sp.]HEU0152450.1 sensor domain-containing diguanylate cyclase [Arenimonas sp.]